jgi:hypothetical protein
MSIREARQRATFEPKKVYEQLKDFVATTLILSDGPVRIDVRTVMCNGILGPKTAFHVRRHPDEEAREFLTLKAAVNHAYGVKS